MKVALAQLNPTVGDLQGNGLAIAQAAIAATQAGAELLVTPELALCGYPPRDLLLNPDFVSATGRALTTLAAQLPPQLTVLVGTVAPNPQAGQVGAKPLFNSAALLQGGTVQRFFHKKLLPTYDVFDEDRYFAPGQGSNRFDWKQYQIGVAICEDAWNDETFWEHKAYPIDPIAALADCDFLVNLSASPFATGKQHLRERLFGHGAQRWQLPTLCVNQVGGNDDLIFDGGSFVCDRQGQVVARLPQFAEGLAVVDVFPDKVQGEISPLPSLPEAEIWEALVLGLRDYARKCGFHKVVLGLSGGIDSALVAAIAAAAVGPAQVLGVLMPSPYSSQHSIVDAQALAANLGIATQMLPIGPLMAEADRTLGPLFTGTPWGLAEENLQSRLRGLLLMAVSNKWGHLLVSTGNKSEMAVGYCTLYGDTNGGLAVIGDLPKTQVYALCRWLNREREIIPENILTKPPSAELRPNQRDQDSLPPYEVLDDILERLLVQRQAIAEIVTAGHDPATVTLVQRLVTKAEFKRWQAPPTLRLHNRAFGSGWRMPLAARRTELP
ncbi:MAG TPA: NAD+ synthase [Cyanobacteria bacterium UBA8156]|nr:NAD+ synthase [Cyanobacteria bacterium UBA8156]